MSNQLLSSQELYHVIDGEVNFQFDEPTGPSLENSSDKKVHISTNFGTSSSNGLETEYFNQENTNFETQIPLNDRESQEERDTIIVENY